MTARHDAIVVAQAAGTVVIAFITAVGKKLARIDWRVCERTIQIEDDEYEREEIGSERYKEV